MKILFDAVTVVTERGRTIPEGYVMTDGVYIVYAGEDRPEEKADRVICGRGKALMPGLYNCHTHTAMSLFRGYGEDMPLQRWLFDKIFPAEDRLEPEAVYAASMLAIAEQLKNGIVSFSDLYFFCEETVNAVAESGMKANISRGISCFTPVSKDDDYRFAEACALHKAYHKAYDGRIHIDMAIHAEYTILPENCAYIAAYAKENGLSLQLHLSETEKEHRECIERNGKTPARFFYDLGVFDVPVTAAHCVWVTDEDIELLAEKGVTAVHNPASNLKLGSGIMPLSKIWKRGVNVTLGTDSAASNNTLDILREMNLAALLQKGNDRVCDTMVASDFIPMATVNGAAAQGRPDCGRMQAGAKADLVLIDLDAVNSLPIHDPVTALLYSVSSSNVLMTMIDGRILYENGSYTTVDIEKTKQLTKKISSSFFK